ncbi:lysophospholipid acyltransferase family protein [Rubrivirga sp. IMCC45206]|uniref:lysophospholipid acyltransferase family protein n=1 Tax=Rubrivirga sp. IMCC45206 TaxID=3391614 RepID=UPI00398FF7A6
MSLALIGPGLLYHGRRPTTRRFSSWMRAWSALVLGGIGVRVDRSGAAPDGPAMLVANHQAMLDIPALFLGVGRPFVFVARSELRRLPLVGRVLAASRCVFLDLRDPAPGLAEIGSRLAEGDAVLMFPEGSRSYGTAPRAFRSGAFRLAQAAGVPVVPVAIDGAYRVLNERRKRGRPGRVSVTVLPALASAAGESARTLAERARERIEQSVGAEAAPAVPA